MNMNDALLEVYKEQLAKYKQEHYIYKTRLSRYEGLNIPPTQDELNEAFMNKAFKDAYDAEKKQKDSDADKVYI
jgi:hypothetical protein